MLEKELLGGQKLQGTLTAAEVQKVLQATKVRHWCRASPVVSTSFVLCPHTDCYGQSVGQFPFFTRVFDIAFKGKPVSSIVELPAATGLSRL